MPDGAYGHYVYNNSQPNKSPNCNYVCDEGYTSKDNNPKCLSNYAIFLDNIGGETMFILVLTTLGLLIVIMFFNQIVCSKKKSIEKMID